METKVCCKCKIDKPIEEFRIRKDKTGKSYRYYQCHSCELECKKIYRKNNKDIIKQYRENHKNEKKQYRKENRDKINEYAKNYYITHRDEKIEYQKKYEINRKNNDRMYKLKCQVRCMLWDSFHRKGYSKNHIHMK